jgi:hypothetical protein
MVVKYVVATCLSGTTESGWSVLDKTMTIVNGNPTITSYTEEETDPNILSVFGGQPGTIIRYASDLLFTINATANKYATISSVSVNGTGATYDSGSYKATITNATATDYSIVVTDSRGYTTPTTFTSTIVNYIPPNINSNWTVERASQVSSDLVLNATIDAFNEDLDTGITNNVVVQYSMDNETWATIPSTSYTYANNEITITNLTLANIISYQSPGKFYLKAYDLLRTHQDNKDIPRGIETFSYGESDLQVNGDLFVADANGDNPINVLNTYTTTEKKIGLWIDGKPLYRKVINTGQLPNATTKQVAHGISNVKRFINIHGYAYTQNGQTYPLPWIHTTSVTYQTNIYCDSTYVNIVTGVDRTNINESYVILEYTKTTD